MASNFKPKFDIFGDVIKALQELNNQQVLVGVPGDSTERDDENQTNASIAYLHEFGSPANNIPARPFLIPGIDNAEESITHHLKLASGAALEGDSPDSELQRAGLEAVNSVRRKIQDGPFVPLSPETIKNRRLARGTKSMRKSEIEYMDMINSGMDAAEAQNTAGIKPLINTGQLRNSISFVLRKK